MSDQDKISAYNITRKSRWIFFFAKEDRFLMLFQTFNKLTFGLSDILTYLHGIE